MKFLLNWTFENLDNGDSNLEADLDRAEKEIEQLKTDREVAIEKKDKQVRDRQSLGIT